MPASSPQISRVRSMSVARLVAGEAEQVPAVVHPLVDRAPRDQRRRALVDADEVDEQRAARRRAAPRARSRGGEIAGGWIALGRDRRRSGG